MSLLARSMICSGGHTFDIARQGYLNLLLRRGNLRQPTGDTREMLEARRRFLEAGHFLPLVNAINHAAIAHLASHRSTRDRSTYILDSGCGEGYYLSQLAGALSQAFRSYQPCYFGVDVAKAAARLASGQHHALNFIVSDIRSTIPLEPGSAALILDVFAPRNVQEFTRLIAENGLLIVVIPAPDHLVELRQRHDLRGLGIREEKETQVLTDLSTTFEIRWRRSVQFQLFLSTQGLTDLVAMTPAARHLTEPDTKRITGEPPPPVTAGFTVLAFHQRGKAFDSP